MKNLEIKVENVTRLEGHGSIRVKVKDGQVVESAFDIIESPRFFEVMLQGRKYSDSAPMTSRICGICAVSHTTVSLEATEDAFGIVPTEQTMLLRKLIFHGEMIQSHVLHVYFLVAPDLLGVGSVIPLASTHLDVVRMALRLKKLGNDICAVVGGRHVHPISMAVNGFTKVPAKAELSALRERMVAARADLAATVELLKTLPLPDFTRETEYLSLKGDKEYPFIEGDLVSSDGYTFKRQDYLDHIKETVVPTCTAKHVKAKRPSYMVGALARFNNNHELLHPAAKAVAKALGLTAPCHNPFFISVAQLVETVHCNEDGIAIIDQLLARDIKMEPNTVVTKAGRGVGVVEAPRGILFHDYTYDADGYMQKANCIIPTGQNIANIDHDMNGLIPVLLNADKGEEEISKTLQILVRAYDPCISCAVHAIEVEFVK
ncbi:MAG TPA: Ni/Fe hydrogenase subunit alpha [Nitrospirota bacterium]